jgi:polygalacturonase
MLPKHVQARRFTCQIFLQTACVLAAALTPMGGFAQAAPASPLGGAYDVRAFGAAGDGVAEDTAAIERAIDAAASAGGGTVRFPAGTYLSGTLHLKSNITLDLGSGATLLAAAPKKAKYDDPEPGAGNKYQDFGHCHWRNSLIYGENLDNVSIIGSGQIWGKGLVRGDEDVAGSGNKAISLKLCRNVTLRDFTIRHGGWFGILATGVDNLTIDNLRIDTNRDGMDIDCCRNVRVSNCGVNSPEDDGICLKSTYGLGFARSCEDVTITNCQVSAFKEGSYLDGTNQPLSSGSRNGRIKFGTESNGGFKNITISNCVFDHCLGLALESVDGALLEDVSISNITMRDVVSAPIYIRLGRRMRGPSGVPVGAIRRVSISDVTIYNADPDSCAIVTGVPGHPVEDLTLSNIRIWYKGGGTKENAAVTPPEKETDYPDPRNFGMTPAYGFFLRHVKSLDLDRIQTHTLADDQRPPFVLEDADDIDFERVKAQHAAGVPLFVLHGVTHMRTRMTDGAKDAASINVKEGRL